MSITSEEVNYLIYRYLLETGMLIYILLIFCFFLSCFPLENRLYAFQSFENNTRLTVGLVHSSFVFGHESMVLKSDIKAQNVPPGQLVSVLQKGLQYMDIETHVKPVNNSVHLSQEGEMKNCVTRYSLIEPHICRIEEDTTLVKMDEDGIDNNSRLLSFEDSRDIDIVDEEKSDPLVLEGHSSEVYICSWNPKTSVLASGSADMTARIWDVNVVDNVLLSSPRILNHDDGSGKGKDVTTLDWNPLGTLLATGSYDGAARIWNEKGELTFTAAQHRGPIFALKWNRKGNYLLSGSFDKTSIVWDINSGELKQQFAFHSAATLDVDWKNNNTFASCSSDKTIHVCKLGDSSPLKTFTGHTDEVNTICWDPSGSLLASCSDDGTCKLWSMESDSFIHNLVEHKREIYSVKWSPTGPKSDNPNASLYLATASFDCTVKLWDPSTGLCLNTLQKHKKPVYSICFSPDGKYIASGSFDHYINVWSVSVISSSHFRMESWSRALMVALVFLKSAGTLRGTKLPLVLLETKYLFS